MKLSKILILGGILSFIGSVFLYIFLPSYLGILSLFISILSFVIGLIQNKKDEQTSQLNLEENRLQHEQLMDKIDNYENLLNREISKKEQSEREHTKTKQLMEKVTSKLSEENLSKEEILRKMDKPINCLIFSKTEEASLSDKDLKLLRDNILPNLGFKFIKGSRGIYFLPPSKMPLFKDRKDIENWVELNIKKKLPKDYRYIFSFISILDLRFTVSIKEDKLTKKYDTLLESINAEELLNFSQGLTYLQKKRKISLKDLINIPNFGFLLENTSLDLEKKNLMKDKNEEIIKQIEKDLQNKIKTEDIAEIDTDYLLNLMKNYVEISRKDIEIIKLNANFWKTLEEKSEI